MAIADKSGKPVSVYTDSATPHDVELVEKTLENRLVDELPEVLIGDKAYDSDKLDQKLLEEYGIILIAPNRKNRKKLKMAKGFDGTEDAEKLKDCFPGCKIFVISESGMITILKTIFL